MSKLREAIAELRRQLTGTETDAEEVFAIISRLDRELKVRQLDRVKSRVMRQLEEARERRWDFKDLRLFVKYEEEVDIIPPWEKSSPIFAVALTVEQFCQVVEKTAKLIREGSGVAPFVLLKETADEELSGVPRIRKGR